MPRSILYFPGSADVPGMPKLDVTESEIAVANIPGLKYWPGLYDWDFGTGKILDRVTDAVMPSYGAMLPSAQVVTLPNGKKGYNVTALANALVAPSFDTSGSFTIGLICTSDVSFGSTTETAAASDNPAPWGVFSDLTVNGQTSWVFGPITVTSSTTAAWAKKLAADKMTAVVVVFDRAAQKVSIRYDGVEMWSYTNAVVKNATLHKELMIGGLRIAGVGRAISTRSLKTNAFVAFESAVRGEDLKALEAMLMEAAAA